MNFEKIFDSFNKLILFTYIYINISQLIQFESGIDRSLNKWLLFYLLIVYIDSIKFFFITIGKRINNITGSFIQQRLINLLSLHIENIPPLKFRFYLNKNNFLDNTILTKILIKLVNYIGILVHQLRFIFSNFILKESNIFIVILAGVVLRLMLINVLPITNDEGSYFYDGYLINKSLMPYRDFLTKSLPHIYLISIFTKVFGNTIFAGRIYIVLVFIFNSFLIYQISRKTFNKKIAMILLIVYSLYPEIASLTTYAQIQQIQTFFCLFFMYLIIKEKYDFKNLFFMALLILFGYISRSTSIIYIPIFFLYIFFLFLKKEITLRELLGKILTFLMIIIFLTVITFLFVKSNLGYVKTLDFFSIESVSQTSLTVINKLSTIENISIRLNNGLAFIRFLSNMPLLFTSLFFLFFLSVFKKNRYLLLLLSVLIPLSYFMALRSIYYIYYSTTLGISYLPETLVIFVMILLIFLHSFRIDPDKNIENFRKYSFVILTWFVLILTLYVFWIKFNEPYFIEFIPVLILSIGLLYHYIEKNLIKNAEIIFILIIYVSITFSQLRSFTRFYTGSFNPKLVKRVNQIIIENSTKDDRVLTASLIFPFVSERNIPFNISHPYWYGYPFIDKRLLESYMPKFYDFEIEMLTNPPKIIVYDKTTYETFFRQSKKLRDLLKKKYTNIYDNIPGDKNSLRVYLLSDSFNK